MDKITFTYPALITAYEGTITNYTLVVPNFPFSMQFGYTIEDLIKEGEAQLKKDAVDWYRNYNCFPTPVNINTLNRHPDEMLILMTINYTDLTEEEDNRKIKKHIRIPSWLNRLATDMKVNFTEVLITALEKELDIITDPKTKQKRMRSIADH